MKKILKGDIGYVSKSELKEFISQYLSQRSTLLSGDLFRSCPCGGKNETVHHYVNHSTEHVEVIDRQQKQLEVRIPVVFVDFPVYLTISITKERNGPDGIIL